MSDNNQEVEAQEEGNEGEPLQKVFEFEPKGLCQYRQRGPYLVCVSCELQHAVYIGMDRIMTGEDENGKPILKLRSEL